jgi:hypothetical protein
MGSRWLVATCLFCFLSAAALGGLLWRLEEHARRDEAHHARLEELLSLELRAQRVAPVVPSERLAGTCRSSNFEATCTFTNLMDHPVSTCVLPKIQERGRPENVLYGHPMCIGPIQPSTTKVVTAPLKGTAESVCYSKGYGGRDTLDWSKCDFTTEPVPVPAG